DTERRKLDRNHYALDEYLHRVQEHGTNLHHVPPYACSAAAAARPESLPDQAKRRVAFLKICVIRACTKVVSRIVDTLCTQSVGGFPHPSSGSVSPYDCLTLPVIREAPSNSTANLGEMSIDDRAVMIRPLDHLTNGRRWALIQRCLKRLQDGDGFHSA